VHEEALGPRGWLRLAVTLYLATAACVTFWTVLGQMTYLSWSGVWFGAVLIAYCLAFALGLRDVRLASARSGTSLLPYHVAFGDDPILARPTRRRPRLHAGLIVPFVIHATCGLLAGTELVYIQLSDSVYSTPLRDFGLGAGFVGVLLGWIPPAALATSAKGAGWALVAGVLGPFLVFAPFYLR